MLTLLISSMLSLTLTAFFTYTPLTLGLWILYMTLAISISASLLYYSWLAVFILLIYVSGLLVMFAYFVALSPNNMFNMIHIYKIFSFFLMFNLFIFMFFPMNYPQSTTLISYNAFTSLFSTANIILYTFLVLFLFFVLVAVVKVSKSSSGPLRPWK